MHPLHRGYCRSSWSEKTAKDELARLRGASGTEINCEPPEAQKDILYTGKLQEGCGTWKGYWLSFLLIGSLVACNLTPRAIFVSLLC
jgi:hypothetical protein